jgi:hypothetical protein
MRVGQKQKKIDINIPKLDDFIHNIYIHSARKIYTNVYLFEVNVPPLQVQKQYRETELIVQECILNTIRESIPVEAILMAYMDETVEENVVEEIKEEVIEVKKEPITQVIGENKPQEVKPEIVDNNFKLETVPNDISNQQMEDVHFPELSFSDVDFAQDINNTVSTIDAPKTIERLEQISVMRNEERKREMDEEEDEKIKIFDEPVSLNDFDIHDLNERDNSFSLNSNDLLGEIEILA